MPFPLTFQRVFLIFLYLSLLLCVSSQILHDVEIPFSVSNTPKIKILRDTSEATIALFCEMNLPGMEDECRDVVRIIVERERLARDKGSHLCSNTSSVFGVSGPGVCPRSLDPFET